MHLGQKNCLSPKAQALHLQTPTWFTKPRTQPRYQEKKHPNSNEMQNSGQTRRLTLDDGISLLVAAQANANPCRCALLLMRDEDFVLLMRDEELHVIDDKE
ncbi:unnamed protein product [Lathyrus oleraceus]